jgi:hypothetical protein
LPTQNLLQAAFLIEIADAAQLGAELAPWRTLTGDQLTLHVGAYMNAAHLVTCRPEDRAIGAAHWVHFQLTPDARRVLGNFSQRAFFHFDNDSYRFSSELLSDDFRQSLMDDLLLSDRDSERRAG